MVSFSYGQQRYDLLLKNGIVPMDENAAAFAASFQLGNEDLHNSRFHLIVQFAEIPTNAEKAVLENMGVIFQEYLPNFAYVASFPLGFDLQQLTGHGVRHIMRLDDNVRMSKDIFSDAVPAWAVDGNHYDVYVVPYADVPKTTIEAELNRKFQVIDEYEHPLRSTVRIHANKLDDILALPYVRYIEPIAKPSTPDDTPGRNLHRSSAINNMDSPLGRHYDGDGVTVGLADDGPIGPHIDYTGRLTDLASGSSGSHGDMTAGIMFGAGNRDPYVTGHATGAYMYYFDIGGYVHVTQAVANYNAWNLTITSTSYSQGTGGQYTNDAANIDAQIVNNPQLMHIFSAGNSGASDHGYGAGPGWGNITGGYKAAKHVIASANLRNTDQLENSSSRGPADDGRIKPDLAANGFNQLSTAENNTTQVGGGTSAAAPSIAGTFTQLYHAYKDLNSGNEPDAYLIKAIMLNTTEDLDDPGPDYKTGWGRINALRAVRLLENSQYMSGSVSQGGANTHTITVPSGAGQLRAMVYWLDPAGSPSAQKALVNDLNITVTDPNTTVWQPWVLDPTPVAANLDAPATRGVDNLNVVEQVTIDNPAAGTHTVTVNGTSVPMGPQEYYLVWEIRDNYVEVTYPMGGESFDPGSQEFIRWDAYGTTGTFTLEYSTNNGSSWQTIANNVNNASRHYVWTPPSAMTGEALVRITNGALSDVSDNPFSIIDVPFNLAVDWVCPDSLRISWTGVFLATGYEVSMLGQKYMDSIGTTTATGYTVTGLNPQDIHWFSVRALGTTGARSQRAVAIPTPGMTQNCILPIDIAMSQIISPAGAVPSCQSSATSPVTVEITNNGTSSESNIDLNYSFNGGPTVTETYAGPIAAGNSDTYTFTNTVNLSTPGTYTLDVWVTYPGDGNSFNDMISSSLTIVNSTIAVLPLTEDFESMNTCPTTSNCESTTCPLSNGWINEANITLDDIDWRVDNGGTPSQGTGPSVDHNPGTAAGNYVYLEASNGCEGKVANLLSPCIDLTNAGTASFQIWYHMNGTNQGELHIDVLSGGTWNLDVIGATLGNQGNVWRPLTVDLTPYVGNMVNVRVRGVTGPGFTSDLALDDVNITSAVGISKGLAGNIKVYPNPSEGQFNVELNDVTSASEAVLTVSDLTGKKVYAAPISLQNARYEGQINLSNLPKGVYILSVEAGSDRHFQRLTIQ